MNENYDAVVIGGRVAGASTALLLARAGVRVALIERSRYGTDTLSTHGLMRAGVLQLTRWGLLGDITAAGTPPIPAATFHYADDESTFVTIRPHAGVDALYAPRRYLLDRILVEAAAAAGAEVRHESTLAGVLRDHHDHVVGVRTVDRKGSPAELGQRSSSVQTACTRRSPSRSAPSCCDVRATPAAASTATTPMSMRPATSGPGAREPLPASCRPTTA
jgi:flavin-dependent dehydrogenase